MRIASGTKLGRYEIRSKTGEGGMGETADHRSDLFSFGAILYEMLSGNRAFRGDSVAETMSAILREEPPDLSKTNKTVSPALERVVQHCLEKNPDERFHSARALAFAIGSLRESLTSSGQTTSASDLTTATEHNRLLSISRQFRNAWLPWTIAELLLLAPLAALPFAVSYFRRSPAKAPLTRFSVPLPEKATFYSDGGDKFEFGTPTLLFRINSIFNNSFDVTTDGQRFIAVSTAAQTQTAPLTVAVNWTADLKR